MARRDVLRWKLHGGCEGDALFVLPGGRAHQAIVPGRQVPWPGAPFPIIHGRQGGGSFCQQVSKGEWLRQQEEERRREQRQRQREMWRQEVQQEEEEEEELANREEGGGKGALLGDAAAQVGRLCSA
mmetsp:Transcript_26010/g.72873  ORF Transcript_26010/g.72873 Transcript_26010/m.72873 type:complete len:127 (-) Transcript_26010:362-742(-)